VVLNKHTGVGSTLNNGYIQFDAASAACFPGKQKMRNRKGAGDRGAALRDHAVCLFPQQVSFSLIADVPIWVKSGST
jgi:hypothetical protein